MEIEVGVAQLVKEGEIACGDQVEIVRTGDGVIVVLSDGMGSGVKASILAGLTAKIAATMMKKGASLSQVVDTIVNTLPVCQDLGMAYSTFTIVQMEKTGKVRVVEYDNPPAFYFSRESQRVFHQDTGTSMLHGKKIFEAEGVLAPGDSLTLVSDGVVHAGKGNLLSMGWQWEHVAEYLRQNAAVQSGLMLPRELMTKCHDLYDGRPADDATAVTLKYQKASPLNLLVGPPVSRNEDVPLVKAFLASEGSKVICGGTAANIVARETGRELVMETSSVTDRIPPISRMKGIDLITEGVITLDYTLKTLRNLERYHLTQNVRQRLKEKHGAGLLSHFLLQQSTSIHLFMGHGANEAHRQQSSFENLNRKYHIVGELVTILKKMGKQVTLTRF